MNYDGIRINYVFEDEAPMISWEQKEGYIATGGEFKASVRRRLDKYVARVGGLSAHWTCDTEQEAKEWAETWMNEFKKEFSCR